MSRRASNTPSQFTYAQLAAQKPAPSPPAQPQPQTQQQQQQQQPNATIPTTATPSAGSAKGTTTNNAANNSPAAAVNGRSRKNSTSHAASSSTTTTEAQASNNAAATTANAASGSTPTNVQTRGTANAKASASGSASAKTNGPRMNFANVVAKAPPVQAASPARTAAAAAAAATASAPNNNNPAAAANKGAASSQGQQSQRGSNTESTPISRSGSRSSTKSNSNTPNFANAVKRNSQVLASNAKQAQASPAQGASNAPANPATQNNAANAQSGTPRGRNPATSGANANIQFGSINTAGTSAATASGTAQQPASSGASTGGAATATATNATGQRKPMQASPAPTKGSQAITGRSGARVPDIPRTMSAPPELDQQQKTQQPVKTLPPGNVWQNRPSIKSKLAQDASNSPLTSPTAANAPRGQPSQAQPATQAAAAQAQPAPAQQQQQQQPAAAQQQPQQPQAQAQAAPSADNTNKPAANVTPNSQQSFAAAAAAAASNVARSAQQQQQQQQQAQQHAQQHAQQQQHQQQQQAQQHAQQQAQQHHHQQQQQQAHAQMSQQGQVSMPQQMQPQMQPMAHPHAQMAPGQMHMVPVHPQSGAPAMTPPQPYMHPHNRAGPHQKMQQQPQMVMQVPPMAGSPGMAYAVPVMPHPMSHPYQRGPQKHNQAQASMSPRQMPASPAMAMAMPPGAMIPQGWNQYAQYGYNPSYEQAQPMFYPTAAYHQQMAYPASYINQNPANAQQMRPPMPPGPPGATGSPRMPYATQPYVPPAKSQAIKIVDPSTGMVISDLNKANDNNNNNNSNNNTVKPTGSPAPGSRAIPIVKPAEVLKAEEEAKRKEEEEAERKRKEEEEAERKRKEEEAELKRKAEEEAERKRKEEEEAERKRKEEEEAERKRKEEEEAERKRKEAEEAERKRKEEEEIERKRKEEEAERKRKEAEEAERKRKEEEETERKRKEAEEAERKRKEAEETERKRKEAEEAERKRKEAEEATAAAVKSPEEPAAASMPTSPTTGQSSDAASRRPAAPPGLGGVAAATPGKMMRPPPGLVMGRSNSESMVANTSGNTTPTAVRNPQALEAFAYPPGIKSPFLGDPQAAAKFKYDRSFLLQFKQVCTDKPTGMPTLDNLTASERGGNQRGGSQRNRRNGPGGGGGGSAAPPGIKTPGDRAVGKDSEARFKQATLGLGQNPVTGSFAVPMNRPLGGSMRGAPPGLAAKPNARNNNNNNRGNRGNRGGRGGGGAAAIDQALAMPLADVKPLNVSESGWKPMSRDKKEINERSPEMVTRKIKSLLNKLTLENFDSVSAKIVEIANYSEDEPDGATLKLVIQLLFEKATDEPNFSSMWAQLANKMLANISTEVEDKSVLTREGVPMCGGVLFRKYLLNRCQEEFEKGWKVEIPKNPTEDYLMSDEYYTAAKAKRRGLGLVEFIGELFKLGMLTEKIMHECVRRLLSNVQDPEEEETESMAKLMSTIGKMLDHREARNYLNAYFHRIQELSVNQKLSSRIRFMLLDLIELRNDKWIPRHTAAGPKTIAQIHEEALKQKQEAEAMRRAKSGSNRGGGGATTPMGQHLNRSDSRGGSGGNANRGGDGWSTVGGSAARKINDLSSFGNLTRSKTATSMSLGPGGNVFGALGGGARGGKAEPAGKEKEEGKPGSNRSSIIGTGNMFSALMGASPPTSNLKDAITSGSMSGKSASSERPKLKLLPRTKTVDNEEEAEAGSTTAAAADTAASTTTVKLTKQQAKLKVDNMVKEFLQVNEPDEVIECIKELGSTEYHKDVILAFVNYVLERKVDDVNRVASLFKKLLNKNTISTATVTAAFTEFANDIEDMAIDVPSVYKFTSILMVGANVTASTAMNVLKPLQNSGSLSPPAPKFLAEYLKALRDSEGEEAMLKQARSAGVDFRPLFPVAKQGDDTLADYLDMQNLLVLAPALKVAKALKRAIGRDSTDDLIKLCENEVDDSVRQSDEFLQVVSGAIYRYVISQTIMANGVRQPVAPTPEIETKEEELLQSLKPLLVKYTQGRSTNALTRTLFAAQQVASTLSFPQDWTLRMFKWLLANQIISAEVLKAWKNDTQHEKDTKSSALREVETWLASSTL